MTTPRPDEQPPKHVVILVHGTFASSESDEGSRWWQLGSDFRTRLKSRLPKRVSLAGRMEMFRWSGENRQSARDEAAEQLLVLLQTLEEQQRPYHLVGHSHGGSVIWLALQKSLSARRSIKDAGLNTRSRDPQGNATSTLDCLHSWTTVGTPFLHFRPEHSTLARRVILFPLSIALLLLSVVIITALGATGVGALDNVLERERQSELQELNELRNSLFADLVDTLSEHDNQDGVESLYAFKQITEMAGEFEAHYDSEEMIEYTLISELVPDGWYGTRMRPSLLVLICTGVPVTLILLLVAGWLLAAYEEGERCHRASLLVTRAADTYIGRWLGIWSPDDEAINGLAYSVQFSPQRIVPRREGTGRLVSSVAKYGFRLILVIPFVPLFWALMHVWAKVFNRIVAPTADRFIAGQIRKAAQGNENLGAKVESVSSSPLARLSDRLEPVPRAVTDSLLKRADQSAAILVPSIRRAFGHLCAGSSVIAGDHVSDEVGLIHTSYFDDPNVTQLLALHIAHSFPSDTGRLTRATEPALMEWFTAFKEVVQQEQEEVARDENTSKDVP